MDADGTTRLETFSDGVFAIAATLLVLEIGVSSTERPHLGQALLDLWPSYLAYATSFLTIGIIWINHHYLRRDDGALRPRPALPEPAAVADRRVPALPDEAGRAVPAAAGRADGGLRLRRHAPADGDRLQRLVALREQGPPPDRRARAGLDEPRDHARLQPRSADVRRHLGRDRKSVG